MHSEDSIENSRVDKITEAELGNMYLLYDEALVVR